jgi:PTH1 family peptidyl-tRNA hydrolase
MKLIVGLGNPGYIYARNRHNIGFMCVSHLAREQKIRFDKTQGHARTGLGRIAGQTVLAARPQTFMNASGEAVKRLADKFNIAPADIIVIHDDLDLPLGRIRLRLGGSPAGHRGLDSIISHLGSRDFYRAKIGIGRPDVRELATAEKESAVVAYVLSDFTNDERKTIDKTIPEVSRAIESLLDEGLETAMNKFNRDMEKEK